MTVYQFGRQDTAADQATGAVEILQHEVQQFRTLHERILETDPGVAGDKMRDQVEFPGTRRTAAFSIEVVGDVVLADLPPGLVTALAQLGRPHVLHRLHEVAPVRPHRAGGIPHFVMASGRRILLPQTGRIDLGRLMFQGRRHRKVFIFTGTLRISCVRGNRIQQVGNLRRSSVKGCSRVVSSTTGSNVPGVWPISRKRAMRRDSASLALTGKVS